MRIEALLVNLYRMRNNGVLFLRTGNLRAASFLHILRVMLRLFLGYFLFFQRADDFNALPGDIGWNEERVVFEMNARPLGRAFVR